MNMQTFFFGLAAFVVGLVLLVIKLCGAEFSWLWAVLPLVTGFVPIVIFVILLVLVWRQIGRD